MKSKFWMMGVGAIVFLLSTNPGYGKEQGWQEYRSSHFIIYYKDVPQDFLRSVEETAETYYQEISRNLGFTRYQAWTWDQRAKLYIYRDYEEYVAAAKGMAWSHGFSTWKKKEIHTFPTAEGFFDTTLPHELGHIIFREFVGANPYIPLWLDEGVAMYQEKAKRWGVNREVKKAIEENKFIPLRDLSSVNLHNSADNDFIRFFYVEAASIVYYLISEFGQYRFADFCKKLREGSRFENALRDVYMRFDNIDDLNNAWVDYLKR